MSSTTQPDTYGVQWIAWAKEEIIALHDYIKQRDGEIDALKKKYSEMKDGLNGVINRQRVSHNDYANETDQDIAEAYERGARSMLEHIIEPMEIYPDPEDQSKWATRYREAVMQTWRDRQKK